MINRILKKIEKMNANKNSDSRKKYLEKVGAKIGKGSRLNCVVDGFGSEPYLVTIGENCVIAAHVNFITHDGGINVLNNLNYFSSKSDIIAPIKVGNNVYIGMDAYIMPGVTIGNNVIIGAKAVVTHDIPDNSVAVGIPARVIKNIDDYYNNAISKGVVYPTKGLTSSEKREYLANKNIKN